MVENDTISLTEWICAMNGHREAVSYMPADDRVLEAS
jgi:hypothetical protein